MKTLKDESPFVYEALENFNENQPLAARVSAFSDLTPFNQSKVLRMAQELKKLAGRVSQ